MKQPTIFICHSSRDKEFVRQLVVRLRTDGVDTWLDELEIHVGDSIHQKVNEGLKKSDFVAVVLSRSSVASRWVQDELSSASALEKYSARGILVLPLLLEECEIPPLLLDRRYANFKDDPESAYQELLDAIRHHFATKHPEADLSNLPFSELDERLILQAASDPTILLSLPPRHFEELIALLLRKAGYDVQLTTATRDGGYDIVAVHALPLLNMTPERILVQCKRYSNPVGLSVVYSLIGARLVAGATRAMLVTTSRFTPQAINAAGKGDIYLADGQQISRWIARFWRESGVNTTPAG